MDNNKKTSKLVVIVSIAVVLLLVLIFVLINTLGKSNKDKLNGFSNHSNVGNGSGVNGPGSGNNGLPNSSGNGVNGSDDSNSSGNSGNDKVPTKKPNSGSDSPDKPASDNKPTKTPDEPTPKPNSDITLVPTQEPTKAPTKAPTLEPTKAPASNDDYVKKCKEFLKRDFGDILVAFLADVTHDGEPELIFVAKQDYIYIGWVWTDLYKDVENFRVIEQIYGSDAHSAGYFNWYLKANSDGSYNLCQETDGMFTGMGELRLDEYYLDHSANRHEKSSLVLSTDDPKNVDANGMVSDAAYNDYVKKLGSQKSKLYCIYETKSASSSKCKALPGTMLIK